MLTLMSVSGCSLPSARRESGKAPATLPSIRMRSARLLTMVGVFPPHARHYAPVGDSVRFAVLGQERPDLCLELRLDFGFGLRGGIGRKVSARAGKPCDSKGKDDK